MSRNDKLYEESRIIRKLANEGKTTKEIMEELSLSAAQIKYRVTSRYSEGIAAGILKKLANNDVKNSAEEKVIEKDNKKALVIDTSSLGKRGSFEFIKCWPKVILLVDVVKELEKRKTAKGVLGQNIRHLLKASAKDSKSKQFEVVLGEKTSSYVDEIILDFCKGKEVVLYTADNGLANMAKGYGIEYIRAKDATLKKGETTEVEDTMEDGEIETSDVVTEATEVISFEQELSKVEETIDVDVEELVKNMQVNSIEKTENDMKKTTIDNVRMLGKQMFLTIPQTFKIAYTVLRGEIVKNPIVGNSINLELGDLILVMTYKLKHNGLCVARYEITDFKSEEHALYLGSEKVSHESDLDRLKLPKEAIRQVRNYYALVRTN